MKKFWTFFCFIIIIPWQVQAQFNNLPEDEQRLLLELSSGYYNVASVGQINLDSCLIAASSYLKMSRIPVITEGLENEFKGEDISWIDKRDPATPKKELGNLKNLEKLKLNLLIGAYYAFQSGNIKSDADSSLVYLFKAKQESEAIHAAFWLNQTEILISKAYLKKDDPQKAEIFTNSVIQNCRSPLDLRTQAKACYYYGTYCPFVMDLTKGRIARLEVAAGIYHQLKDHSGEIISYTYQCNLNGALGKFMQARKLALFAIKLETSINFPFTQYNKDQVAMFDGLMLDYIEMLNYAEQEIDDAKNTKVDFGLSMFYGRLALAYSGNDYSNPVTEFWFKKSVDEAMRNPHFYSGYYPVFSLADKMIDNGHAADALSVIKKYLTEFPPRRASEKMQIQGMLGDCYAASKDYPDAKKKYLEAIISAKDPSNASNPETVTSYLDLAIFYTNIKKYKEAKPLLLTCLNDPVLPDMIRQTVEFYLTKVDSASGNFSSALAHSQKFNLMQVKIFDKRGLNERARLETKFETKEKEQSIKLLQLNAKAGQAELKQIGLQRNLTFGGVVALFLVSGLVYNGYRNKKRSNLLLNIQQKEINKKNASLERTLLDKDLLLKEVNHRVKNNLHIVMSLLESQSAYVENDLAHDAIKDSQNRVQTIALIHQKLYNSENITQVDMQSYIPELIDYLNDSINFKNENIVISHDIEYILLDVSQAIPAGIILNEAITNAIKYAFPKGRKGEILVSMRLSGKLVILQIRDNGGGLPLDYDSNKTNSLGANLIKGLTNQLKGTLDITSDRGVSITVKFKIDTVAIVHG
jgi:two-component system, sensor histidine kinase PdtaS